MSRPAAVSTVTLAATCATISARCSRRAPLVVRVPGAAEHRAGQLLGAESGREGERDGRAQRHDERERQHAAIDGDLAGARREAAGEVHEQAEPAVREGHAHQRAQHREDHGLGEQDPAQPAALGAHRPPDGELAVALEGAREHQIGHVRAGGEEHEPGDGHQQEQRLPRVGRECLAQGRDAHGIARGRIVVLRVLPVHARGDVIDLGLSLLDRGARRNAREHVRHSVRAAVHHRRIQVVRAGDDVDEKVGLAGERRRGLENADDRDRPAVHAELPADHIAFAAELPLPVLGRQHHHGDGGRSVIPLVERTSQHGAQPHHREVVAADDARLDLNGSAEPEHRERHGGELGEAREESSPLHGSR
jgi:hypothetical protein